MNLKINSKKVIASVMALSIVASGVLSTEASVFSKIVPTNTISASAAISYGDWEYEETPSHTARLTKYTGNGGYVLIPEAIDGHTVTQLGVRLFKDNTDITSVAIPRGITEIPNSCFRGATNLESVAIPQGVNKIDSWAFAYTPKLNAVYLSTALDQIGCCAFNNSGISYVSIPSATVIDGYAFENCENLKSIKLPNNLKTLKYESFKGCKNLESVIFPATLSCIDSDTFADCENLKSITLPNNLTTIKFRAFQGCKSLETITIPESVTSIGSDAFADCTSLKTATFSIYHEKMLGNYLFENCNALENINFPYDKRFIHDIIYQGLVIGCPNFKKVNNEYIVTYRSQRYNPNAEPIMRADFMEEIMKDFSKVDEQRIDFFEEYFKATIKYIVGTNTYSGFSGYGGQTTGQKIKALYDWVCNKVDYAYDSNGNPDPSNECHVDSSVFFRDTTVCDGYARALTLLLREAGIEAYFLYSDTHAWCMVKLGDRYFHIDACHEHFLMSDKDIKGCPAGHSKWEFASPSNTRIDYTMSSMPTCDYSIGDANMDGSIDKKDAQLIKAYTSNKATLPDPLLADTNFDGKVDLDDMEYISMFYIDWE